MSTTTTIPDLLDQEIDMEIRELAMLTGEERTQAAESVRKLYELRIEEMKVNLNYENERDKINAENERTMREFCEENRKRKEERLSTYLRCGVTAAEILLTLAFNYVWMQKGLQFEETGSFTSTTFRNLISRFRPSLGSKV